MTPVALMVPLARLPPMIRIAGPRTIHWNGRETTTVALLDAPFVDGQ